MPMDLGSLLLLHVVQQRRAAKQQASQRVVRQNALAALHLSPVHVTFRAPLAHPATLRPISVLVAHDTGVRHPTPAEVAQQLVQKSIEQAHEFLAQMVAKQQAWMIAHPRPDVHAQPSDVAAWLKAGGLSPRASFPEWNWQTIRKTSTPGLGAILGNVSSILGTVLEPGEAIAQVQLGPNDVVVWYEHPSGAWSYYHHWGQDIGQILASVASTISDAVSEAAHALDVVLKTVQTVASLIPGVGQVVNGIVTAAEAALDALGGMSGLQIALDTAYHAALAAVPGAEALAPMLDPIMGILKNVAGGQSITKAALGQALTSVPDQPNIGGLSPRSVAGSLASWLASKVGIHV
jgi:hypothetical protein